MSLFPPRLAGLFEKWTQLVTVEVRCKNFTDYPSKSRLISETTELKIEPNASQGMIQWIVSQRKWTMSILQSQSVTIDMNVWIWVLLNVKHDVAIVFSICCTISLHTCFKFCIYCVITLTWFRPLTKHLPCWET